MVVKLKAQGAPPEIIENYRQQIRSRYIGFDVHQDNWFSFNTFTQLKTQWQIAVGVGGMVYLGLNYTAVHAFLSMKQYTAEQIASLIDDIQIMEQAALAVYNSRKT